MRRNLSRGASALAIIACLGGQARATTYMWQLDNGATADVGTGSGGATSGSTTGGGSTTGSGTTGGTGSTTGGGTTAGGGSTTGSGSTTGTGTTTGGTTTGGTTTSHPFSNPRSGGLAPTSSGPTGSGGKTGSGGTTTAPLALSATGAMPASVASGTPVSAGFAASGGKAPYSFAWGGLDQGLSATSNATSSTVSGVPGATGANAPMTLTVTDSSSPPQTQRASTTAFVVQPPSGAGSGGGQGGDAIDGLLVLPDANLPSEVLSGATVTGDFVVTGGTGPYTATMDPPIPGLSVTVRQGWGSNTAEFTGTPPVGSYPSGRVTVSDSSVPPLTGSVVTPAVSVVAPPAQPLVLGFSPTLPSHEPVGAAVESVVAATGGTPPYRIAMDSPDPGFALTASSDGSSATLSGTTSAGTYAPMTARVTDSSTPPQTATATLNGFVAQDPSTPAIVITPGSVSAEVTVGSPAYMTYSVSGGVAPYAATASTPSDVTFVDYTAYGSDFFYYAPQQAEEIPAFDLTVSDSSGLSTTYRVPKVTAVEPVATPFSLVATQDFPNTVQPGASTQAYVRVVGGKAPFHVVGLSPVDAGFAVPGDPSGYQPTVDVIGTPSHAGSFAAMTLSVQDSTGAVATLALDPFKVPAPPAIAMAALGAAPTDVALGDRYKANYGITGGVPPFVVTPGSTPAGVSASVVGQTVTLSGKPTAVGQNAGTTVSVTDAFGDVASLATDPFTVTKYGSPDTLAVHGNPAMPLRASLGVALSSRYEVFGGTPPYSVTVNHLPSGLSLTPEPVDATGQAPGVVSVWDVSGTPTTAGMKTSSTLSVFDSAGRYLQVSTGELNVMDDGSYLPLTVSGYSDVGSNGLDYASNVTVPVGAAFSGSVYYQGGIEPVTFSVTGGYPGMYEAVQQGSDYSGNVFETVSLFGAPSQVGTVAPITVTATDAVGATASYVVKGFQVSSDAPQPASPVTLTATADIPDLAEGQPVSAAFAATGGTNYYGGRPQSYDYRLVGMPKGLMLSTPTSLDGTVTVVGSPMESGTFSPTVVVSDDYSSTATYAMRPFTVTAAQPSAGGLCLIHPFEVGPYATHDNYGSISSYVTAVVGCGTAPYTVTTATNAPEGVVLGPAGPCPDGLDGVIAAWSSTSDPIDVANLGVTVTDMTGKTVTIPSYTGTLGPETLGYQDGNIGGCRL